MSLWAPTRDAVVRPWGYCPHGRDSESRGGTHQVAPEATIELEARSEACFICIVNISYAVPQAHGIVNVTLHRKYSPSIIFIFSQGRNDLYHV
jgi:hypothetical protein